MDAFSYLSVLLSIILGLAITQVLQGYRALLLHRGRISFYPPTLIWSALVLLIATQMWWSSFGLARHQDWTFVAFAIILLQTVLLYMMSAIVLPDIPAGEPLNLREHYFREHRPFFLIAAAIIPVSMLKDFVIDGHPPLGENLMFHLLFGASWLAAAFVRNRRFHDLFAPLAVVFLVAYIAALFARL